MTAPCGGDAARCCGVDPVFDPSLVGYTVGELCLRGWDVCPKCGRAWLSQQSEPCPAPTWTLAAGGRSVDIGNGRIRYGVAKVETGERLDVPALMARIARVPDLERENERLRKVAEAARNCRWTATPSDDGSEAVIPIAEYEALCAALAALPAGEDGAK